MIVREVLKDIPILYKSDNYNDLIEVSYISDNTKDIKENSLFICIKGNKFDSHDLINLFTIKPKVIIAQRQIETDIPYIIINDTNKLLPLICFNYFRNPSEKLNVIGVTGTDGKTTTSLIIKQLIDNFKECAYIGTNGFSYKKHLLSNNLTTPKPIILNRFFDDLVKNRINYASIEVSSQGLDFNRVDYITFKVAVFTNLSHEHLDHHKTIENYFESKLKLFKMLDEDSYAIINIDEKPYANMIINNTKAKVLTYGKDINADFRINNIKTTLTNTTFDLLTPIGVFKNINLNLFGDYNAYNATAALLSTYALGFSLEKMIPLLSNLKAIDGRMHIVNCGQPFNVIVDFAHTPNALNSLLKNINLLKKNNLTVIFGSAGERDTTKRPLMGETVNKYATNIILTDEDPKSEESLDIIKDILKGIDNPFKVSVIPNRKNAIIKTLDNAKNDDIVVVTGKGNEKIQVFNGYIVDHNDIDIATNFLYEKYQQQSIHSIANI